MAVNEKEILSKLIVRWNAACRDASDSDAYQVKDGKFSFTIPASLAAMTDTLVNLSGIPSDAQRNGSTYTWESVADTVFAHRLPSLIVDYELRQPQLHMARLIQRAKEMRQHAVIEAATGTGKSYAYLYTAMELGLKVIVSTSNKALQGQLINKDVPTVLRSYPGKTFALAQGKSNYACKEKAQKVTLTGDLAKWFRETESGNLEDINFYADHEAVNSLRADDSCTGRRCEHYEECFYYAAKDQRQDADIVVTNHALLAIHLQNPEANILPQVDMIIVDEAHKFADYVRNYFSSEVKLSAIDHNIDTVKKANIDHLPFLQLSGKFTDEIKALSEQANPHTINNKVSFSCGIELALEFRKAAEIIFPSGDVPMTTEARQEWRKAKALRSFADRLTAVSACTADGFVRWIEAKESGITITSAPWNIAKIVGGILYPQPLQAYSLALCGRCGCDLLDSVAVLGGRGYCADCILEIDPEDNATFMPFSDYIAQATKEDTSTGTPFIFCSATLATPTLDGFKKQLGITSCLEMIAPSPFNFKDNALLYIPSGTTPDPKQQQEWAQWVADDMRRMVLGSKGGAFLLFTSYKMMRDTLDKIGTAFASASLTVLAQGKNTKAQIISEFKNNSNCVLFGTKSFWEGIDIQGYNLRLIYIDKLPFAPPHPLTEAIKVNGAGNWFTVDLPLAIQDLKQGAGRLIRTATDKGVIAIGDTRIRTAQYGRDSILPSLPPATLVSNHYSALDFLNKMQEDRKLSPLEVFGIEREFIQPVEIDGMVF